MEWRHIKAALALPVLVAAGIPILLGLIADLLDWQWVYIYRFNIFSLLASLPCLFIGLVILLMTNFLFDREGDGTLAPWDPPKELVIVGLYRYVRNPMIVGVLVLLLGEFIATGSLFLLIWGTMFFIGNHVYFLKSEEPGLEKRFGEAYLQYKAHVPRWLPRLRPWDQPPGDEVDLDS